MTDLLDKIAVPGSEFRGAPFWSWNSKLEPGELRRQIRLMHEMGLGGFFMHARVGLNTEYLGKEWFDCVRACVDEAKKLDMHAWMYDEDRWPSGAAGGFVTREEQYRIRMMVCDSFAAPPENPRADYTAVFAGKLDGHRLAGVRRLPSAAAPLSPGETMLGFRVEVSGCASWFNDQAYLDVLNPAAVRRFLEVTHEAYKREVGGEFGKTIPGMFTDEPNFAHCHSELPHVPWTGALAGMFRERFGYDLADRLPELFFVVDGEDFSDARYHFRELLTSLFVDAVARQTYDWCEANHLEFTGHVNAEDSLIDQTVNTGSAMRFYEYMQAPGIDLLTEHWNVFDTAKQCTSVARQFGRRRRITETYGCTGWDFPFAGHKALGDWQFALGINVRCQHLAWYSMAAQAKRDYPASIFYQSPWYREYRMVEDYFARLGAALSEGSEVRSLLVVTPVESTWGLFVPTNRGAESDARENLRIILPRNAMLKANLDFDYGDEDILARHGGVSGGKLNVALGEYRAVLLPEMRTVRKSTLELLAAFRRNGGAVAYLGAPPDRVDGLRDPLAREIYASFAAVTLENAAAALSPAARLVSITGPDGGEIEPLLHIQRRTDELATLFVCNTSMNMIADQKSAPLVRDRHLAFPEAKIKWQCPAGAEIYELNLADGKIWKVDSEVSGDCRVFATSFDELESRLFFASRRDLANSPRPAALSSSAPGVPFPADGWEIKLDDFNVLVLDHAEFSVNGKPFGRDFVMKIDDRVREAMNVRLRGGAMVQPWLRGKETPKHFADVTLDYRFGCDKLPATECFLGIECPELYEITLNGAPVPAADRGYWCDRSMRRLALAPELFRAGENHLRLKVSYHECMAGLEAIFLLGDFGVRDNTLIAAPGTLRIGDWCDQGLENYAGNVTYSRTFVCSEPNGNPRFLRIPEWRGAALGVSVNGSPRRVIGWPPCETDIAPLLKEGLNRIEITVFGHRRNSHGPFYIHEKWPAWTGHAQFKEYFRTERQLVPCGLLANPTL